MRFQYLCSSHSPGSAPGDQFYNVIWIKGWGLGRIEDQQLLWKFNFSATRRTNLGHFNMCWMMENISRFLPRVILTTFRRFSQTDFTTCYLQKTFTIWIRCLQPAEENQQAGLQLFSGNSHLFMVSLSYTERNQLSWGFFTDLVFKVFLTKRQSVFKGSNIDIERPWNRPMLLNLWGASYVQHLETLSRQAIKGVAVSGLSLSNLDSFIGR